MDDRTNDEIRAKVERLRVIEEPEETAEQRKAANEVQQEARLERHLVSCGVPTLVVSVLTSAAKLRDTPAVLATREWVRSGHTFLVLRGVAGGGKTVAAAACLKMARVNRYFLGNYGTDTIAVSWAYSSSAGMFARATELAGMAPWAQEGRGRWTAAREVPWLILDDLGMERMDNAGVWAEQLDLLVDLRYQESLKTIITTNLDRAGLERRYGARIMRRLTEAGTIAECAKGGA